MKLQMSFGENLVNLRKQKGWSQDDLAENLNLSRQAISKWENDTSKPDIDNVMKISKLFSVTIDDLVNNDVVKDKAVTLNVKKEEKKERLVIIVKCMIIAIILLYVINVIYKFASLLIIVNGIQKYANLSNYHYVITTYDENGLVEKEECWFKDGILKIVNESIIENNLNKSIINIDYNQNTGYIEKDKNKTELNNQYLYLHYGYKNGGRLFSILPLEIRKYDISFLISEIINTYGFSIYIPNEDIILLRFKEKIIKLDKTTLLPTYVYDLKNSINYNLKVDFEIE